MWQKPMSKQHVLCHYRGVSRYTVRADGILYTRQGKRQMLTFVKKDKIICLKIITYVGELKNRFWHKHVSCGGCFYWCTTQFEITDTALNYSMTNNVKRRWCRRENRSTF